MDIIPLRRESPPSFDGNPQPLSPEAFRVSQDADRLWNRETIARARAVAQGLGSLDSIDDPDLRHRISAEFDAQIRMLVKHVLDGLLRRDTSGALSRALANAREVLGQEPEEMPFMNDLVMIARGHLEDLIKEDDGLSDVGIARFSQTLEAVLGPQLDRFTEIDNKKNPPGDRTSGREVPRAAA